MRQRDIHTQRDTAALEYASSPCCTANRVKVDIKELELGGFAAVHGADIGDALVYGEDALVVVEGGVSEDLESLCQVMTSMKMWMVYRCF